MRKMKKPSFPKKSSRQSIAKSAPALEWLEDISGKAARTISIGSRKLLVENHTGVIGFSDCEIQLNTGCGIIRITGKDLSLTDVRRGALIVHGEIQQVQLPCEGSADDER